MSVDTAVEGRRIKSPLVAERHVLLKADKVVLHEAMICL